MSTTAGHPPQPTKGSTAYRVDLDGLRGFAIALVVLFHVFVGRVSGGVDVFLLLSGYFFLGGQLRYALRPNPNLNPWWPLWRTIRRLVPALALVVVVVVGLVMAFTPELMGVELSRQVTASMLYFQNWELMAQNADYAAASQETSPLQHLWSMSVQGQFYVFGILLGWIIAVAVTKLRAKPEHARRAAIALLAVITVASFAWASRFGLEGTGENYYSTFSRAWELSLGALLAFVPAHRFLPQATAWLTALLGVALIAVTGVIVPTSLAFPGPVALIPLTGAALVILSGNANGVSKVLASAPMTWLGSVAYSLYLWHWPLLIIVTVIGGYATPPAWLGGLVILVSLCLAHVTHTLVEDPLRQHRPRPRGNDDPVAAARASLRTLPGVARAVGGVLAAALFAVALAVQPYWDKRVDSAEKALDPVNYPGARAIQGAQVPDVKPQPDPSLIAGVFPPIGLNDCMIFLPEAPDAMPGPDCTYGDLEADTTIVLAGGSHIEPFIVPLDKLGKEHHFKVATFVRQECPLVVGGPLNPANDIVSPECAEWGENAMQEIINLQPDLLVSTSTRPAGHAGDGRVSADYVPDAYANLWQRLAELGIPFVGLRDNPWMFTPTGEPMDPNLCVVAGHSEHACSMAADMVYAPKDPAAYFLDGGYAQWEIDTAGWYCVDGLCPPQIGNVYIYRDQNHISNAYAESLTPVLWERLAPIFEELSLLDAPPAAP
ncbi:O-acetyltransferase OatA [Corynebacterium afermentans subsp. afermentans]|uniref:Peptidoglycan/LPS O-acetylase OafA/YrhL, contains acyltransferase and SGNH-hydrolase domains n=1 Tax=Corynebacterium afermentans TaxID=38286 RepID=A0A9X8R0Y7_9CORY|nr:acyltransferase family protein [Corynebacterium afermentans]WJY57028.1 O-acetyltransferase OatA [Corynebacterium afermentans subsp. afermentans]SIP92227.1 Peptidoglycan/LPS O-acetylase OafA/YrhL, contains acyltransferase and SGNH-hydrolase domains [Corynebacterium afermentans]